MNAETIAATEGVRTLRARYCRFADTKQWDAFKNLFVEDVDVLMEFGPRASPDVAMEQRHFTSREQLVTENAPHLEGITTIHNVFSSEIEVLAPDRATGIWAMNVIVFQPHCIFTGWGHYHEVYTKKNGFWQFESLNLKPVHVSEEWLGGRDGSRR